MRKFICLACEKEFESCKYCKNRKPKYCSKKCYALSLKGAKPTKLQLKSLLLGRSYPHTNKGSHWSEASKIMVSKQKKGVKLSEAHKLSLSLSKKGKPIKHFIENKSIIRIKISNALIGKPQPWNCGEKHHNWQGGKTLKNAKIRNSIEMKNWRRAIFERDDYICRICNKRGGRLIADHIKPFSLFPKLRLDIDNGRTLCHACHLKTDTYGGRVVNYG